MTAQKLHMNVHSSQNPETTQMPIKEHGFQFGLMKYSKIDCDDGLKPENILSVPNFTLQKGGFLPLALWGILKGKMFRELGLNPPFYPGCFFSVL